jgi:glucose-6-phosphate isomerase
VKARFSLGEAAEAIQARIATLERDRFVARLIARDETLWSPDPSHHAIARDRLGWLEAPARMRSQLPALREFSAGVRRDGYRHAVLLGMGGSSLAAEVFRQAFGAGANGTPLTVLDSTSPGAVRAIMQAHDPRHTLFVVSSKSGTTVEVQALEKHFHQWVYESVGKTAGKSFVAITDPDTPLERLANERGYRRAFLNPPDIGGRYSALSYFGLVPAALLGADLDALLEHALDEARVSGPAIPAAENRALELGAVLGELALRGRDKVTFVLEPDVASLGDWVEQLLAESTGKEGKGLIPVVGEPLGAPDTYGRDRVFVAFYLKPLPRETDHALDALERAGHPVLRWRIPELPSFGAEFLRWEIATAVAAAVLGVDPFDEPNVAEAKQASRAMIERAVADGSLPPIPRLAEAKGIEVAAPPAVADALRPRVDGLKEPVAWLAALLTLARPGDYFGILAYLHQTPVRAQSLERLRAAFRAVTHGATTVGYGPRYLHSTGQLHKGGAPTGVFLELTADEGDEIVIPGERYGFGTLIRAQAAGDYQVLERRGRRVLWIHLGSDPDRALAEIAAAIAGTRVAIQ